jgi:two-component system, cell cycle sensor histidine kinase and response regulator CckA
VEPRLKMRHNWRDRQGPDIAKAEVLTRYKMFGAFPKRNPRGQAADTTRAEPPGGHETILLVEDEPAIRQLFVHALTRAGYTVHEARNGQDAMKIFDQHGDTIDLLLTDMRMPYMGGGELAQLLRARRQALKLLCISGCPSGVDQGLAADFLAKPFSRADLLKKVREILDRA